MRRSRVWCHINRTLSRREKEIHSLREREGLQGGEKQTHFSSLDLYSSGLICIRELFESKLFLLGGNFGIPKWIGTVTEPLARLELPAATKNQIESTVITKRGQLSCGAIGR